MAFNKARYIHRQTPYGPLFNGFSVHLSPMPADLDGNVDHRLVCVRYTLCSKQDLFSRAKAREVLADKPVTHVRVIDLPAFLMDLEDACYFSGVYCGKPKHHGNMWAWVYKYFL